MLSVSQGWANDLSVTVTKQNKTVLIHYQTVQDQGVMCGMSAQRVVMDSYQALPSDKRVPSGLLEIETAVPANIPCLMAVGPHSGAEVFKIGPTFPKLKLGKYQLWINGEDYGLMNVKKGSVSLTP
jgi:hypothetical protein